MLLCLLALDAAARFDGLIPGVAAAIIALVVGIVAAVSHYR